MRGTNSKHTPPEIPNFVDYLWDCGDGFWGHGGAYRNQFAVEPKSGVTCVLMVQSAGAGGPSLDAASKACRQAAVERFGK